MKPRLGLVGAGRMGANMARRLHELGFPIAAVLDRNRAAATALAGEIGAEATDACAQVTARGEIILTVVSDDAAMQAIFADPAAGGDSLLIGAAGRLFINCATVSPAMHREVETRAQAWGAATLEASMASSIPQARAGTLFLMCAGAPEAFARAEPVLQALGREVLYIGAAGQAAKLKALVNLVMNINTAGLAEGLGLADALGLDLDLVRRVFAQTGAASRVLETDADDMIQRAHEPFFSVAHAAKDCGIALDLAREAGLTLPLATATAAQYTRLIQLGRGELDKSAVAELTFRGRDG